MRDHTKAVIGAYAQRGWKTMAGFAWGSAVGNVDNWLSRVLLLTFGLLYVVDRCFALWWGNSDEARARRVQRREVLAAGTVDGLALDASEVGELHAFIERVKRRHQEPKGKLN